MRSSRDFLAIYRRKRSKLERKTVSGASSMMSETPVAFSKAIIFLPSFPMSFPLRSSLSSVTSVCVVSPVTSHAYCCIELMRSSRVISTSRDLRSFFFFSISFNISFSYLSSVCFMRSSFASSVESLEIFSSFPSISLSFLSHSIIFSSSSRSFSERLRRF